MDSGRPESVESSFSVRLSDVEFERALIVFAHPDDAEFGSAGTVAKWVGEGTDVGYLCVTDGSAGSNEVGVQRAELAVVREREQREACAVLGVKEVTFLGIHDGMVSALGIPKGDRFLIIDAVPADSAQDAVNALIRAGVKIVFNYSEALLDVPSDVQVHTSNPAVELLYALYFHLT